MVRITDKDIERVEHILLPEGCTFNDERRKFIHCMESRDVVACPGSGKTASLLAKIIILASKMPFPDNRGICVLTHTNVAIDEIKARLGTNAEYLFCSPNFFGTIQSFVDRFLAIPAYRNEFRQAPQSINWEIYLGAVNKLFTQNQRQLYAFTQRHGDCEKLAGFWFSPNLAVQKSLDDPDIGFKDTTPVYKTISSIKLEVLKQGYLSYNDAYSLALRYVTKYPSVIKALQSRFIFTFIDEMQDTDSHQLRLFEKIFDENNCIVQCLGDPNQAIFGSQVKENMFWKPSRNPIHFSDTKRFGRTITNILKWVRVDRQISLKENPNQDSLPPHIITYTDDTREKVLHTFARLIQNNNLHHDKTIKKPTFKAVGWIGRDKIDEDKLCLRFYFPDYRKSIKIRKQYFSNLLSYLYLPSKKDLKADGAKIYKDVILQGIVHGFDLGRIKHPENNRRFTPDTFLKWLRENNEPCYSTFITKLSEWILLLHRKEKTPLQIRDTIAAAIRNEKDIDLTTELELYLTNNDLEFSEEEQKASNIFISDNGIPIEVGTVHSVKGETHTATLYLETFYYDLDSKRLLPFLKGKYPEDESQKVRHRENLKIAHVAFSRPTHLLAFACHEDNINGHEKELTDNGWSILKV